MVDLMNDDMMAMPRPLPETINISTSSLRRLKYCATISVEQSRVIPTPIPITAPEMYNLLNVTTLQDLLTPDLP